jgi:hypothetical protein
MATPKKLKPTGATKNAVAPQQPGGPLALADELARDANGGLENVTASDMAIPFLVILQALSPQIRGDQAVKGAKEGMLYDTVSGELYEKVHVIPCAFNKMWVEWVPREKGGGFVTQHPTDELMSKCTRNEKNIDVLPNGNHLVQTAYHFCLLIKPTGEVKRIVIGMMRTQLKKSRRWVSRMTELKLPIGPNGSMVTPPTFSHAYPLSTETEERNGNLFKNFAIGEPVALTKKEIYLMAREFHNEVIGGAVKITPPTDEVMEGAPAHDDNNF